MKVAPVEIELPDFANGFPRLFESFGTRLPGGGRNEPLEIENLEWSINNLTLLCCIIGCTCPSFYWTKKVKEGTKGQKQIVTENQETLTFYRNMVFGASAIYFIGMMVFSSFSRTDIFLTLFAVISYTGSYQFMVHMSKAKYSNSGQLIDSGVDLNMKGGVAEHVKDLIILTAGCQVFSLYSNYFWLLWLLAPMRGLWILWKNILQPYFFQEGPANPEMSDKKQKKLKRKSKWQPLQ